MEPHNLLVYPELCAELMSQCFTCPLKLEGFVLCGKEPMMAFLDIVRTLTHISFRNDSFVSSFDHKNVKQCRQNLFGCCDSIDKQLIFKQAKQVTVYFDGMTDECFENVMKCLIQCTNIEQIFVGSQRSRRHIKDKMIDNYLDTIKTEILNPVKICNSDGSEIQDPKSYFDDFMDVEETTNQLTLRVNDEKCLEKIQEAIPGNPEKLVVHLKLKVLTQFFAKLKLCSNLKKVKNLKLIFAPEKHLYYIISFFTAQMREILPALKELVVDLGKFVFEPDVFLPSFEDSPVLEFQKMLQDHTQNYKISLLLQLECVMPQAPEAAHFYQFVNEFGLKYPDYQRFDDEYCQCRFQKLTRNDKYEMDVEFLFKKMCDQAGEDTFPPTKKGAEKYICIVSDKCLQQLKGNSKTRQMTVEMSASFIPNFCDRAKAVANFNSLTDFTLTFTQKPESFDVLGAHILDFVAQIDGVFPVLQTLVIQPGTLRQSVGADTPRPTAEEIQTPISEFLTSFQNLQQNYKIDINLREEYCIEMPIDYMTFYSYLYKVESGLDGFQRVDEKAGRVIFEKTFNFKRCTVFVNLVFSTPNKPGSGKKNGRIVRNVPYPEMFLPRLMYYTKQCQDVTVSDDCSETTVNVADSVQVSKLPLEIPTKKLVVGLDFFMFPHFIERAQSFKCLNNVTNLTFKFKETHECSDELISNTFSLLEQIEGVFGGLEELVIDLGKFTSERLLHVLQDSDGFGPTAAEFPRPVSQCQKIFTDESRAYKITLLLKWETGIMVSRDDSQFEDYFYSLIPGFLEFNQNYINDNEFQFDNVFESPKFDLNLNFTFLKKFTVI